MKLNILRNIKSYLLDVQKREAKYYYSDKNVILANNPKWINNTKDNTSFKENKKGYSNKKVLNRKSKYWNSSKMGL